MDNWHPALQTAADGLSPQEFCSAVHGWLLSGEIAGWSPRTLNDRRDWMRRLRVFLEDSSVHFDAGGLRAFFVALQRGCAPSSIRVPSRATVKHVHSLVTAFAAWCVEEAVLGTNPMRRIPAPSLRDDGVDPYSDEELARLLGAARKSRNAARDSALLYILMDTGIRASELAALRLQDTDLTARTAMVRYGKGGRSRQIAFGKQTAQAIWRYLRITPRSPEETLFASQRGGEMTRGSLLQLCRRLGTAAGVRGVHPHRFRHDAAVRMLRNGAHVFAVMAELGHSRVQVTERYVKLAASDVQKAHRTASPVDNLRRKGSNP
jgi:integrase/recombinase XerD